MYFCGWHCVCKILGALPKGMFFIGRCRVEFNYSALFLLFPTNLFVECFLNISDFYTVNQLVVKSECSNRLFSLNKFAAYNFISIFVVPSQRACFS